MSVGLRIGSPRPSINNALLQRLSAIPVANISDVMLRIVGGGAPLRPIGRAHMAGPAFAVKTAPGDNLMVHKALDIAPPGSILVVDAGGELTNSIIGERMVEIALHRGLAGIIINGAIRDADAIKTSDLPVFAAGVTHRGPYKNGPGEINFPISIGGMVIESGDIIVGDDDGFVSIPVDDCEKVCEAAEEKFRYETDNSPLTESRVWIDESLKRLGCEVAPEYRDVTSALAS